MRPRQTTAAEAAQRQYDPKAEAKKKWMEELLQLKQEVTMLREAAAQSEVESSTQRSTLIQATTQGMEDEETCS